MTNASKDRKRLKLGFDAKRIVSNRTGIGNYSRYILRTLLEYYPEHRYYLFAPSRGDETLYEDILAHPSVELILPTGIIKGSLWRTCFIKREMAALRLDIYHGLSNELPLKLPQGVTSVVTLHDLIFERFPKAYKPIDQWLYHVKYKNATKEVADGIIAVSEMTKQDLGQIYGISSQKIEVIYQGCDELFRQTISEESVQRELAQLGIVQPYYLAVGTWEWRKNFGLIVKALPYLPNDRVLVIVGRETAYAREVMDEAERLGVAERVIHPKQITNATLQALYAGASLFIYPSRFEGFGIPIIEALSMKLPVIAATGSCLEEAGGKGALYIAPDDVHGLVEAVSQIENCHDVRERLIADGQVHLQRFSKQEIARKLMAYYTQLISRG